MAVSSRVTRGICTHVVTHSSSCCHLCIHVTSRQLFALLLLLMQVYDTWEDAWGENATQPSEFDTWYEEEDYAGDASYEYD